MSLLAASESELILHTKAITTKAQSFHELKFFPFWLGCVNTSMNPWWEFAPSPSISFPTEHGCLVVHQGTKQARGKIRSFFLALLLKLCIVGLFCPKLHSLGSFMEDYSCCTSLRDLIKYTQEKEIEREAKKVQDPNPLPLGCRAIYFYDE